MKIFLFLLFTISLLSCSSFEYSRTNQQWTNSDLIALDPADVSNPGMDIIALYTRSFNDEIQVRLDFLDLSETALCDLHLALDTIPGGSGISQLDYQSDLQWEDWIKIPAAGDIQVYSTQESRKRNWRIRVFRDAGGDFITVRFYRTALLGPHRAPWEEPVFKLQAFTTKPDSQEVIDGTRIASTNNFPPIPVKVLFAFTSTMPGYTPSQVLRKWDGAHTGPFGGRHGLYNLLRTARSSRIPLFLLDLKYPPTLAALETFGGLETIRQMEDEGLLGLPLPLPDTRFSPLEVNQGFLNIWIQNIEKNANSFGLQPSHSLFNPESRQILMNIDPLEFQSPTDEEISTAAYIRTIQSRQKNFNLPPDMWDSTTDQQVDFEGPTLDFRRELVSEAIYSNLSSEGTSDRILVLGGDLPASALGHPQIGRATFQYIASHPWIKTVDQKTLESLKPSNDQTEVFEGYGHLDNNKLHDYPDDTGESLLTAIGNLPDNQIARTAVDSYNTYFYPVYPFNQDLVKLRGNYTPHLWTLVKAAEWASNPTKRISCDFDIDHDGSPECLLTSKNVYAVIEPVGGYLSHLFIEIGGDFHQIIGPSSQFTIGTTDPFFWDLEGGINADPRVLAGAFEDPGIPFQAETLNSSVKLSSNSSNITKTFKLLDNGITVDYSGLNLGSVHAVTIPLAPDPWMFYSNREIYPLIYTKYKGLMLLNLDRGDLLQIETSAQLQVDSYQEATKYFNQTENPNFDYPPGFFIPYPISLISINAQHDFQISFLNQE